MLARDTTWHLPIELFAYVLDYLPQPDVLRCARVSRRWRTISSGHSSYYCFAALRTSTSPPWSVSWHISVSNFCNTLHQCRRRGVNVKVYLAVAFEVLGLLTAPDNTDTRANWPDDEPFYDLYVDRVLPAVEVTLPFIIDLRIYCGKPEYHGRIYDALRGGAAPVLRSLCLDFVGSAFDPAAEALPADIFSGSAPRLRKLELYHIALPLSPLQVFGTVAHVELELKECASFHRVLAHFPNATHLDFSRLTAGIQLSDRMNEPVDHRLHSLIVWFGQHDLLDGKDIAYALDGYMIPSVTINPIDHHTRSILPALQRHAPSALVMTIQYEDQSSARVVLSASPPAAYVRSFAVGTGDPIMGSTNDIAMVLEELRPSMNRLVSITIDNAYLADFMHTVDVLPNLETFTATIARTTGGGFLWAPPTTSIPAWTSFWACRCVLQDSVLVPPMDDQYAVQCPKIAELVVHSVIPVCLNRCQAAHLGRCLGILLRLPHDDSPDGPVLCLGTGVSLQGETHTLARVFPSVRHQGATDDAADV